MVGAQGHVIGIDMTPETLEIVPSSFVFFSFFPHILSTSPYSFLSLHVNVRHENMLDITCVSLAILNPTLSLGKDFSRIYKYFSSLSPTTSLSLPLASLSPLLSLALSLSLSLSPCPLSSVISRVSPLVPSVSTPYFYFLPVLFLYPTPLLSNTSHLLMSLHLLNYSVRPKWQH